MHFKCKDEQKEQSESFYMDFHVLRPLLFLILFIESRLTVPVSVSLDMNERRIGYLWILCRNMFICVNGHIRQSRDMTVRLPALTSNLLFCIVRCSFVIPIICDMFVSLAKYISLWFLRCDMFCTNTAKNFPNSVLRYRRFQRVFCNFIDVESGIHRRRQSQ